MEPWVAFRTFENCLPPFLDCHTHGVQEGVLFFKHVPIYRYAHLERRHFVARHQFDRSAHLLNRKPADTLFSDGKATKRRPPVCLLVAFFVINCRLSHRSSTSLRDMPLPLSRTIT